jgi:hypothetical protein
MELELGLFTLSDLITDPATGSPMSCRFDRIEETIKAAAQVGLAGAEGKSSSASSQQRTKERSKS